MDVLCLCGDIPVFFATALFPGVEGLEWLALRLLSSQGAAIDGKWQGHTLTI